MIHLFFQSFIFESLSCKTSFEVMCRDDFCWTQLQSFEDACPSWPPQNNTVMQENTPGIRGEGFSQFHHLVGWCNLFTCCLPTALARADGHELQWWPPTLQTFCSTWRMEATRNFTWAAALYNGNECSPSQQAEAIEGSAALLVVLAHAGLLLPHFHDSQNVSRWCNILILH